MPRYKVTFTRRIVEVAEVEAEDENKAIDFAVDNDLFIRVNNTDGGDFHVEKQ